MTEFGAGLTAPVLFLDFDGVLHPTLAGADELMFRAGALAALLDAYDLSIVISSSWRYQRSLPSLKRMLPPSLARQVIDVTGPAFIGKWARWHEVTAWATSHRIRDWRALDDSAFEFPPNCSELIRCNGATGVQETQLRQIAGWLDAGRRLQTPAGQGDRS